MILTTGFATAFPGTAGTVPATGAAFAAQRLAKLQREKQTRAENNDANNNSFAHYRLTFLSASFARSHELAADNSTSDLINEARERETENGKRRPLRDRQLPRCLFRHDDQGRHARRADQAEDNN